MIQATDHRRYPRMDERGCGLATNRQLWRLNQLGMLAIRKAPGEPIANRKCAAVISEAADAEQRARWECDQVGVAESAGDAARRQAWEARAEALDVRSPQAFVKAGMRTGGWPDSASAEEWIAPRLRAAERASSA